MNDDALDKGVGTVWKKGFVRMEKFGFGTFESFSYLSLEAYVFDCIRDWIDRGGADNVDFEDSAAALDSVRYVIYDDRKIFLDDDVAEDISALLSEDDDFRALIIRNIPKFIDRNGVESIIELIWLILFNKVFIDTYGKLRDVWRERKEK